MERRNRDMRVDLRHLATTPKTERPRKMTVHADRLIKRICRIDPLTSTSRIIAKIDDLNISERIIRRRLV